MPRNNHIDFTHGGLTFKINLRLSHTHSAQLNVIAVVVAAAAVLLSRKNNIFSDDIVIEMGAANHQISIITTLNSTTKSVKSCTKTFAI